MCPREFFQQTSILHISVRTTQKRNGARFPPSSPNAAPRPAFRYEYAYKHSHKIYSWSADCFAEPKLSIAFRVQIRARNDLIIECDKFD